MLKTRIQRREFMLRALNWYQEQITDFLKGPIAYSEAQKEVARRHLDNLQHRQQLAEKSTLWFVPVHLNFEGNGVFRVVITDPSQILYLDE